VVFEVVEADEKCVKPLNGLERADTKPVLDIVVGECARVPETLKEKAVEY
jgi:hypothetical protein